jgi:hypothetical protein
MDRTVAQPLKKFPDTVLNSGRHWSGSSSQRLRLASGLLPSCFRLRCCAVCTSYLYRSFYISAPQFSFMWSWCLSQNLGVTNVTEASKPRIWTRVEELLGTVFSNQPDTLSLRDPEPRMCWRGPSAIYPNGTEHCQYKSKCYVQLQKKRPCIGSIRGFKLAAIKPTNVQLTNYSFRVVT